MQWLQDGCVKIKINESLLVNLVWNSKNESSINKEFSLLFKFLIFSVKILIVSLLFSIFCSLETIVDSNVEIWFSNFVIFFCWYNIISITIIDIKHKIRKKLY